MALLAAFAIAVTATPAGISGAVLLLPFQVSVLGTPSPAVTPTNLLYNVVATPGVLYRYRRQHQTAVMLPLRVWLTATRPARQADPRPPRHLPSPVLIGLACLVGGIGGGSILSPVLTGAGRPAADVAPAARIQARLPDTVIWRIVGVLVIAIGARYLWSGLS